MGGMGNETRIFFRSLTGNLPEFSVTGISGGPTKSSFEGFPTDFGLEGLEGVPLGCLFMVPLGEHRPSQFADGQDRGTALAALRGGRGENAFLLWPDLRHRS